jgi:hypothetical protein
MSKLTREDAHDLALKVKWKTTTCNQGEQCWCRGIEPEEPIYYDYDNFSEELSVVSTGSIGKYFAEYIVELHNKSLKHD